MIFLCWIIPVSASQYDRERSFVHVVLGLRLWACEIQLSLGRAGCRPYFMRIRIPTGSFRPVLSYAYLTSALLFSITEIEVSHNEE
ncbi:hypothetical protein BU24DRAFT_421655 [Aaosphaeria arxii CBS 175.79]|uniref:Uncharacterized protein n=1 Tax=Aaosphaeria arxii CBS 175.79 TaxID=1450172 RepID=A0A6A5XR41_9PLEO|nr:uncharacterized protein BU24DRAFT_421655 [Aaosphaeria arxii CBS 175.79]KAF2015369.1 hypothetical protein BU24DRAFT_421655 [Aaosphaeria arxii CBS 175.79]